MSWDSSDRRSRLPDDWDQIRRAVLRRDGRRCQIRSRLVCISYATDVDHIIPGDDHSSANLRAACEPCHREKSAREGVAQRARLRAMKKRPPPRHPGRRSG